MDDENFNCHLWFCLVEDHCFMAKYIYDSKPANQELISKELDKVTTSLSTLEFISPEKRTLALNTDKYEKFVAALAASFDLKNNALEKEAFIELVILIANQMDSYLRLSVLLKKQVDNKTNDIDIVLLYQGDNDSPITERKVYKMAKENKIISDELFDKLEQLYKKRNKIVHRYIISDLKTKELFDIAYSYEIACEEVRLKLKEMENLQFTEKIGIHGNGRDPNEEHKPEDIKFLMSQVNDKHLIDELKRVIN